MPEKQVMGPQLIILSRLFTGNPTGKRKRLSVLLFLSTVQLCVPEVPKSDIALSPQPCRGKVPWARLLLTRGCPVPRVSPVSPRSEWAHRLVCDPTSTERNCETDWGQGPANCSPWAGRLFSSTQCYWNIATAICLNSVYVERLQQR